MKHFPPNDIVSLVAAAPRYDLAESVGPNLRLAELLATAGDPDFADLELGYGTAQGDSALRAAIARMHDVDPEHVVITVGGMHALFLLAFILCERGDEAVPRSPLFPLARNVLEVVDADVRVLRLSFDRGYRIDAHEVGAQLSKRTKLVSLASPQNPSGVAMSPQTLREILALMAEKTLSSPPHRGRGGVGSLPDRQAGTRIEVRGTSITRKRSLAGDGKMAFEKLFSLAEKSDL